MGCAKDSTDSGPYSIGSIYEAQPRAHIWAWLCVCAQVCAWRGGPDRWAVYTMETPEAVDTGLSKQAAGSIHRNFGPTPLPRSSWEGGWRDHSRAPACLVLSFHF